MSREVWKLVQVEPCRAQKYTGTLSEIMRIVEKKITGNEVDVKTD